MQGNESIDHFLKVNSQWTGYNFGNEPKLQEMYNSRHLTRQESKLVPRFAAAILMLKGRQWSDECICVVEWRGANKGIPVLDLFSWRKFCGIICFLQDKTKCELSWLIHYV